MGDLKKHSQTFKTTKRLLLVSNSSNSYCQTEKPRAIQLKQDLHFDFLYNPKCLHKCKQEQKANEGML